MTPRRRRLAIAAFVGVVTLLVVGRLGAEFVEDLLWYRSLGLERVFWVRWGSTQAVRLIAWGVFAAVLFVNLALVSRTLGAIRVRRRVANIEIAEQLPRPYIVAVLVLVSALSGSWLAAGFRDPLAVIAAFRHAGWGLRDPYFGLDASFFVFVLPILDQVQVLTGLLVAWTAILVAAAYALTGAIRVAGGRLHLSPAARRHLGVLGACFLAVIAWDLWMDRYGMLLSATGVGNSLGYADAHARQPALFLVSFLSLGAAVLVGIALWHDRRQLALGSLAVLVTAAMLSRVVYPVLMQNLMVEPNEEARETPYLQRHIDFTRHAFQLDDIETVSLPYRQGRPRSDSSVLRALAGAPLWDSRPLHTTFNENEALFSYYTFASVHPDRYDGKQVAVSVRELEHSGLDAQTWQNLHLQYVSGQGVVVTPMSERSSGGSPFYYLRDLVPTAPGGDAPRTLQLSDPEIYFGERTTDYVVVGPEALPRGVALTSLWRKLVFAWAFQSRNLLLSSDVRSGSKVVYRRGVIDRVRHLAPFLRFLPEQGAQPVIHGGRIVWLVDGYTVSTSFPLSKMAALAALPVRYARNSVKATVDATTGEVHFFVTDPDDPILRTYAGFFPGLLEPLEAMPEALREHLRYPAPLLELQAAILGNYHLRDAAEFYQRTDVWAPATEIYRAEEQPVRATYARLPLPDRGDAEFLLSVPLSASGRRNLAALLVARNDPPAYGERILYELPRGEQVPGPQQIEAQIDQNPDIAEQLSLWKDAGSRVNRGRIIVLPIDSTLIYLEPLFLEADNSAIPQLERVILATGRRVVMRPTLDEAVQALFAAGDPVPARAGPDRGAADAPRATDPSTRPDLQRVREIVGVAEAQLRAGDWAGFGESWKTLRELLDRIPADSVY